MLETRRVNKIKGEDFFYFYFIALGENRVWNASFSLLETKKTSVFSKINWNVNEKEERSFLRVAACSL